MNERIICPLCGGDMSQWSNSIYECEDCGSMVDIDIFDVEEVGEWNTKHFTNNVKNITST